MPNVLQLGGLAVAGTSGLILQESVTPPLPTVLHSFALQDTSGAGSTGFFRLGLAFEKGDVPSGQIPVATLTDQTPVRSSILDANNWSDGSLRSATMVGEVAGGVTGTETINVAAEPGVQGSSGLADPIAYLQANADLKVSITNHSGSVSGALPINSYDLNTHLATSSRVDITDDTPVCIRLNTWGHPPTEKHLVCLHYVDLWLDSGGSVVGVEWTPVMSQHWWTEDPFGDGSQPKEQHSYDAQILDGATVLETHAGLQHGYHTRWAGLRTDNDAQHAKSIWRDQGEAMPTLNVAYSLDSKRRNMRAGYMPPLAEGHAYDSSGFTDVHVPLGEPAGLTAHNHRKAINGTGGYNGRGAISNMDCMAQVGQTAALWRIARVSAQAGLTAPFHYRDSRVAGADVSAGLIPSVVTQLGAQTYPGLAGEVAASSHELSPVKFGFVQPDGGGGVMTDWDSAHHHNYAYYMAFVEGAAYLKDAVLSAADSSHKKATYNESGVHTRLWYRSNAARAAAQSIPATQYGTVLFDSIQERSPGWGILACTRALQLLPDADRHTPYYKNLFENGSNFINDNLSFFVPAQLTYGGVRADFRVFGSMFMNGLNIIASMDAAILGNDFGWSGYQAFAEQCSKLHANAAEKPNSLRNGNRDFRFTDFDQLIPLPVGVHPRMITLTTSGGIVSGSVDSVSPLTVRDGDTFYMTDRNSGNTSDPLPPELTTETAYHVVNANNQPGASGQWQFAATPGGPPLTISDETFTGGADIAEFANTPIGPGNPELISNSDGSLQIAYASIERMAGAGISTSILPTARLAGLRTFYAPRVALWNGDAYAAWNYDGSLMV